MLLLVCLPRKTPYKVKCGVEGHFLVGNLEVFSSLFALPFVAFRLWVVECVNVYAVRKCVIVRVHMCGVCVCAHM